jgi:glycerol-3-phosphate dehydrogenase
MKFDVVIIGAGLIGTAIARNLSKFKLKVAVLEKGADVCSGSSKATSAIIHPGFEKPGTLKAELCVKGNAMYNKLCDELDLIFDQNGEFGIAMNDEEIEILKNIKEIGEKNGVTDLEIIDRERLLEMEPHLNPEVKAGLYASTGGVVSPYELTIALMENARDNGVKFYCDNEVIDIERNEKYWLVKTENMILNTDYVINAAGIYADKISMFAGAEKFTITPQKGEEYITDNKIGYLVNRFIFSVSGGFVMPTVHKNIMMGTTNIFTEKQDFNTTREGCNNIVDNARKIIPEISPGDIITSFAGLRALKKETDDYFIKASKKVKNFINVSIGTPGVVAAPAIAEMVTKLLEEEGIKLISKDDFNPYRKAITEFRNLSQEEKDELIKKDERYGHIICRCETITEGEIVEAIKRGARTLDGIKYRTRAGMGRCQGGFCTPRVMKILARELNIAITEVNKKEKTSKLLPLQTKELLNKGVEKCKK